MRISKGRGWLAAIALAVGTVQGDYVTFEPSDFVLTPGAPAAVLLLSEARQKKFHWTASNVLVENVTLLVINNDFMDDGREVGFGQREEPTGAGGDLESPDRTTSSGSQPTLPSGDSKGGRHRSGALVSDDIGRRDPQEGNVPNNVQLRCVYRLLPRGLPDPHVLTRP